MSRKLLTIAEVVQETGIPRNTLYKLLNAGTIPSAKIGSKRFISETALDAFIARFQTPTEESPPWHAATVQPIETHRARRGGRTSG